MESIMEAFEYNEEKGEELKKEKSAESPHEFHSQHLQYSEELWDSLENIGLNNKKCTRNMKLLSDFLNNITRQAETFVSAVHRHVDTFEYHLKLEEMTHDTTAI